MPPTTKPANVSDASWAIWLGVRANSAKLESCSGPHDFIDDPVEANKPLFRRKLCTKCGGTVDGINARWYQDGLKHARADGDPPKVGTNSERAENRGK